jgi:hypothetical protein
MSLRFTLSLYGMFTPLITLNPCLPLVQEYTGERTLDNVSIEVRLASSSGSVRRLSRNGTLRMIEYILSNPPTDLLIDGLSKTEADISGDLWDYTFSIAKFPWNLLQKVTLSIESQEEYVVNKVLTALNKVKVSYTIKKGVGYFSREMTSAKAIEYWKVNNKNELESIVPHLSKIKRLEISWKCNPEYILSLRAILSTVDVTVDLEDTFFNRFPVEFKSFVLQPNINISAITVGYDMDWDNEIPPPDEFELRAIQKAQVVKLGIAMRDWTGDERERVKSCLRKDQNFRGSPACKKLLDFSD